MGWGWPLGYRKRAVVVVLAYLLYGHTSPLCVSLSVFLSFCLSVFLRGCVCLCSLCVSHTSTRVSASPRVLHTYSPSE
eukprot:COSAG03_NODE_246_length_10054_cov_28.321145_8_plen_78_part_00